MGNAPVLPRESLRRFQGLSRAEAAERLRRFGPNELPSARPRGWLRLLGEVLTEPMLGLLVACGAIYLALGDRTEAIVLLAFVGVVLGISLYQTHRTDRALHALRDLSSPRALVLRGDTQERIAGREVVPGDLLVLAEGDRVPADGVVLWAAHLRIDEALLTGEAEPVDKEGGSEDAPMRRAGSEARNCVYSGTLVVAGQSVACVRATGVDTEIGRIGRALEATATERTKLERQMARLVRYLAAGGVVVSGAVAVLVAAQHGRFLEGLLAGLAVGMSMIPEEFPVILTIFLALGAWRISHRRVLTRRLPAIEVLGSATVLCVDKTGTLTENRMELRALSVAGRRLELRPGVEPRREELPEEFHELVEYAVLASQRNPFDPMEEAINDAGESLLSGTEHLHPRWRLLRQYPLTGELLAMSHVWASPGGERLLIGAKGAPEAIADLCHLGADAVRALEAEVDALARQGLRVLGAARALFDAAELPAAQHDFDFEFIGLLGLADPVRDGVPAALQECYRAGIRTVMITGDYPRTARAVAQEIGLRGCDDVLSGAELDALSDEDLASRCADVNVFARVAPEQKLRLVRALQARGEVVAMTGDGVNDAPALKAAHIGIAMGGRGTDVAREAAALVLLDDDFASIVTAVRLGRGIFDNIRKAMAYVVAVHVPVAGLALLPVLFGWPLMLLPLHVAFVQLIIDPACSIAFEAEPEEDDVMARPPRDPHEPLLPWTTLVLSLLQGGLALAAVLAALLCAVGWGEAPDHARMLAFSTLILVNLGLILAERSASRTALGSLRVHNAAISWVVVGGAALLTVCLAWPPARALLQLGPPEAVDLGVIAAAALLATAGFDLLKRAARRWAAPAGATVLASSGGAGR